MCKHLNGTLYEKMIATHEREVQSGILDEVGYNNMGEITGYTYRCHDCKKYFHYSSYSDIKQKWLKKIHEQLT